MDTIHPLLRILNTLIKPLLNTRGEVGVDEEPPAPPEPPATNWKDSIPEDIRQDPIFEKYKGPDDAYRALVGAQKFLGREKLPIPRDENDKEGYDLIFKTLGLPESADKYELGKDYKLPDGLEIDDNFMNEFKKIAHENRILPSQFKNIFDWYMKSVSAQNEKLTKYQEDMAKEAENSLRKEWGHAYKQNISLAQKVIKTFGDDATIAELDKGLGNNPAMIRFVANIGKALSEDQLSGAPELSQMTPNEAQSKINAIKGDKKHAYWDANHPNHKEAVEEFSRLVKFTITGR